MFTLTSLFVFLCSSLVLLVVKMVDKNPQPIFGIYQKKSGIYWFKVLFIFIPLLLKRIKNVLFLKPKEQMEMLDRIQKLSYNPKAIDAVYFNGANKHGDYFVMATARRRNRLVDGFIFVKINSLGLGILQSPKAPDTSLFNAGDEESYEAEGIKISCMEAMKKWKLTYNGELKTFNNNQQKHDVTIDAVWSSDEPWYNFDIDINPWEMAKSLAYENWSRNYFKNLKANHQTHIEQFGLLRATITVDGKTHNIDFDTLRDHTIGEQRDWSQFRRYGLHFFTTENGDHFSLGSICMPICFSRLKIGYMYSANDRKIYSVRNSDLELYRHGELGDPPKDYAFTFQAGGTDYVLRVNVLDSPYVYLSKKWEVKVFSRLSTFEVNGIRGWGSTEWVYRNVQGKHISENQNVVS